MSTDPVVSFQLLGPVRVWVGGTELDTGSPQQSTVLAALVLGAGQPVLGDTLVGAVWADDPPAAARRTLHTYVTRIRRLLEHGADNHPLVRRGAGYLLDVEPDQVDVLRYRALVHLARDPRTEDSRRLELLRGALAQWRGEPLAGLPGRWAMETRESLRRQHIDTVLHYARTETRFGDPASAIGPVSALVSEQPLVEPLTGALMGALHAAGRTAEALESYRALRRRLVDELGTEPGTDLRELHQSILRGSGSPMASTVATSTSASAPRGSGAAGAAVAAVPGQLPAGVPAQLPADVAGFTGRDGDLRRLDELLPRTGERPTAVAVAALGGTAGVGKSTLAVHWAHRVRRLFPDGQLYVNLRGFDPSGNPTSPSDALRGFLDALGVPARQIPADLDGRTARYRSLLADRRVLVLLDNAGNSAQVRPLLPGGPGCFVLITSRDRLTGLVTTDDVRPVPLDLLTDDEARALLAQRLGAARVAADPAATDRILALCAGLPLALAIAAARVLTSPELSLAKLAEELSAGRELPADLGALDGGEPRSDLRTVFGSSYLALSAPAARLFRLLGLHTGADISVPATASAAGVPVDEVRAPLRELTRAYLLGELAGRRYASHDLLRAYAGELCRTVDPAEDRKAAVDRLLDHYVRTAREAALTVNPDRDHTAVPAAGLPGVTTVQIDDRAEALAWFTAERGTLVHLVTAATAADDPDHDRRIWQLAWGISEFLDRQGHWTDWVATQHAALAAALRLGDPLLSATAGRHLGVGYSRLGRYDEAYTCHKQALELYESIGADEGAGQTHLALARLFELQGQPEQALEHARSALDRFRLAGRRLGEAYAQNMIGWFLGLLGEHQRTLAHCEQALAIFEELGDRYGAASTWDSIGHARHHLGDAAGAVPCYRQAIGIMRELGARYGIAESLVGLGDAQRDAGDVPAALGSYAEALTIFGELEHPAAGDVRDKIAALT